MNRIVLVGKERILNETLKDLIEMLGHQVVSHFSLRKAMESVDFENADMVLCDIGLNEEEVFELMGSFKREFSIPFVLFSAHSSKEYADKANQYGADRYLLMPSSLKTLRKTLDEFLIKDHVAWKL